MGRPPPPSCFLFRSDLWPAHRRLKHPRVDLHPRPVDLGRARSGRVDQVGVVGAGQDPAGGREVLGVGGRHSGVALAVHERDGHPQLAQHATVARASSSHDERVGGPHEPGHGVLVLGQSTDLLDGASHHPLRHAMRVGDDRQDALDAHAVDAAARGVTRDDASRRGWTHVEGEGDEHGPVRPILRVQRQHGVDEHETRHELRVLRGHHRDDHPAHRVADEDDVAQTELTQVRREQIDVVGDG